MRLQGAVWNADQQILELTDESFMDLPPSHFEWVLKENIKEDKGTQRINIPVYLNSTLEQLLFSIKLAVPSQIPESVWSQRGTCITLWCS